MPNLIHEYPLAATIALVVTVLGAVGVLLIRMGKEADRLHALIDELRCRAEAAMTLSELEAVEKQLQAFWNDECPHHRAFAAHVSEVALYLRGRKQGAWLAKKEKGRCWCPRQYKAGRRCRYHRTTQLPEGA